LSGPIILNGRKLNKFQEWFFKKPRKYTEGLLIKLPFVIMFLILIVIVGRYSYTGELVLIVVCGFIFLTLAMSYMKLIDKYILYNSQRVHSVAYDETMDNALKRYLIGVEGVKEVLRTKRYGVSEEEITILKSSYGHNIFEELKQNAIKNYPNMVGYMRNPGTKDIQKAIKLSQKSGEMLKFKKPYTFEKKCISDLRNIYTTSKGIKQTDLFSKRAIQIKRKEQLVKYLDEEYVTGI